MARDAGFKAVRHVAPSVLAARCFADRADGLSLPNAGEFLVATT